MASRGYRPCTKYYISKRISTTALMSSKNSNIKNKNITSYYNALIFYLFKIIFKNLINTLFLVLSNTKIGAKMLKGA